MLRLLSIFPLTVMMVSDARSRTVSSWWLSAFGLILVVASVVEGGWRETLVNIMCNLFVLLAIGVSLLAYSKMRKRPFSVQLNMYGYQLMVRAYLSDSGVPSISTMFIP